MVVIIFGILSAREHPLETAAALTTTPLHMNDDRQSGSKQGDKDHEHNEEVRRGVNAPKSGARRPSKTGLGSGPVVEPPDANARVQKL